MTSTGATAVSSPSKKQAGTSIASKAPNITIICASNLLKTTSGKGIGDSRMRSSVPSRASATNSLSSARKLIRRMDSQMRPGARRRSRSGSGPDRERQQQNDDDEKQDQRRPFVEPRACKTHIEDQKLQKCTHYAPRVRALSHCRARDLDELRLRPCRLWPGVRRSARPTGLGPLASQCGRGLVQQPQRRVRSAKAASAPTVFFVRRRKSGSAHRQAAQDQRKPKIGRANQR